MATGAPQISCIGNKSAVVRVIMWIHQPARMAIACALSMYLALAVFTAAQAQEALKPDAKQQRLAEFQQLAQAATLAQDPEKFIELVRPL